MNASYFRNIIDWDYEEANRLALEGSTTTLIARAIILAQMKAERYLELKYVSEEAFYKNNRRPVNQDQEMLTMVW